MPSFQISDPTTTVTLAEAAEGDGTVSKGNVVFTVENTTPLNRTATVSLVSDNKTDLTHCHIVGADPTSPQSVSFDFGPRQTQNVTVEVSAKHGSSAQSCAFRLRVTLETEPDNDVAESRPVAFSVPAGKTSLPPSKPFPWLVLVIAGVVVLVMVGVGLYFALSPSSDSGNGSGQSGDLASRIKNQSLDFAKGVVTGAGLTQELRVGEKDGSPVNVVYDAKPDPENSAAMILYYDPGIAALKGKPIADAKTTVQQWGLIPDLANSPGVGADPGVVVAVQLDALDPHQHITLTYDEGVVVPNLVGQSFNKIADVFNGLAGKATAIVNPVTVKDPNSCATVVRTQDPLRDSHAGSSGLYSTATSFAFTMTEGTKPNCLIVGPPRNWVDVLKMSNAIRFRTQ